MRHQVKYTASGLSILAFWALIWTSAATPDTIPWTGDYMVAGGDSTGDTTRDENGNIIDFDADDASIEVDVMDLFGGGDDDEGEQESRQSPQGDGLPYPIVEDDGIPANGEEPHSPLYMEDPPVVKEKVEYNHHTGKFESSSSLGGKRYYRYPRTMTIDEYVEYDMQRGIDNYWRQRAKTENFQHHYSLLPQLHVNAEIFTNIFGSSVIDIKPQGSAELIFSIIYNRTERPELPERLRETYNFDYQNKIQMSLNGNIGDKLKLVANYNTEAFFDFENRMNLRYEGHEDDILQLVEAGNVSLPLTGTLISGSQSLFGIKTALKFGHLTITSIFSQQKGETSNITVEGGAQTTEYEIYADEFERDKHFFLSHFFKDNYNKALSDLPMIKSGINITKIEVWKTNKTSDYESSRNIAAFMDLGESGDNVFTQASIIGRPGSDDTPPDNEESNSLYENLKNNYSSLREINQVNNALQPLANQGFVIGQDYEKIENARKLSESEYTLDRKLGFISLDKALAPDEVLAVAFEFTYQGETYKVGEFSDEGIAAPRTLILKMIKGTVQTPRYPTWQLMMKNVYSLQSWQINPEDFRLDVFYEDDNKGTILNYLPEGDMEGEILLRVMGMDQVNSQGDVGADGVFDFLAGVTINPANGRIFFPVLEPFGENIRKSIHPTWEPGQPIIEDDHHRLADKYVYNELYDSTEARALEFAEKNKFLIKGTYKSASGSEISLNRTNLEKGSVSVTAGGMQLQEGIDYSVDYTLGRVTILNQGIMESGTPINIKLESNSMFNLQTKTLLGTRLDYEVSENFLIGGTIMNLTERPLTKKVNVGDEPISNTIWGVDALYRMDAPWLTKAVDYIPLLSTKEKSSITISGEFAHLIPGHSSAIGDKGVSYIDDFESSKISIDIKSIQAWHLASTPQGQPYRFPEADSSNSRSYGYNRARLAWYYIDPLFVRNTATTPDHIRDNNDEQMNHFTREVPEKEIFPNKDNTYGVPANISVFNLAFYPTERGPYNFDVEPTGLSAGISRQTGELLEPESRWGGIMRKIESSDFEQSNIEFIEFWLMDPFVYDSTGEMTGGDLYFNLGDISEDILKDSRKSFENGLPTTPLVTQVDTTNWGFVPEAQSLVQAFDNDEASRPYQDVGLDGLLNQHERTIHADYLQRLTAYVEDPTIVTQANEDPSTDDFHYFRGGDYDDQELGILERYKDYNGLEGNSTALTSEDYPTISTTIPDIEDINRDNTLNEVERYYQYKISLRPEDMEVGKNYIYSIRESGEVPDDYAGKSSVKWYQFKIPLNEPDTVVGEISDFKSIRFMRMYLRNFGHEVHLRFARLDLVRGTWRKYTFPVIEPGEYVPTDPAFTTFDISAVNIEENNYKDPVNYILPPGIDRVIDPQNPHQTQLNEQALTIKVENLADGDARAAYKNLSMDMRDYKRLEMFLHAEEIEGCPLDDQEVSAFIRIGSDFKNNYYEYEIPLVLTPPGNYQDDSESDRYIVWPEDNKIDISLEKLTNAKIQRDNLMGSGGQIDMTAIFEMADGKNYIRVKGNPSLGNVKSIMIGVKNPRNRENDDKLSKCAEVWFNELRLSEFDESGGWAAISRATAKMADFGTFRLSAGTSKPGFGSIEEKPGQRSKEDIYHYDLSTDLKLDQFFPKEAHLRLPMYFGYSERVAYPEYDPLNPDVPFEQALEEAQNDDMRSEIRHNARDYIRRKSINFTNVTIDQPMEKPRFYDPSNFTLTYSYQETFAQNVQIKRELSKSHFGSIGYIHNPKFDPFKPFVSVGFLNTPYTSLLGQLSINYVPQMIGFRTDMTRDYTETLRRDIEAEKLYRSLGLRAEDNFKIYPTYMKDFRWNRYYDLKWDITQNLRFDFSASNLARIDEPDGIVDRDDRDSYQHWKDSVWTNIKGLGRNLNYNHDYKLTYNVPFSRIRALNWLYSTIMYGGLYDWRAGRIIYDSELDTTGNLLGNTIKNSRTINVNNQINMNNLYNKVGYLKRVNQEFNSGRKPPPEIEPVEYTREEVDLEAGEPFTIAHKLGTEELTAKVTDEQGNEIKVEQEVDGMEKIVITAEEDHENLTVFISGTRENKENFLEILAKYMARGAMSVQSISLTYTQTDGTVLPGYMPQTQILGNKLGAVLAPGFPFVAGHQDEGFGLMAANDRGWLTDYEYVNTPYIMTHTRDWRARVNIEPINDLRIDLDGNWRFNQNMESYLVDTVPGRGRYFEQRNKEVNGNFSMSYNLISTTFEEYGNDQDSYWSKSFENLRSYRLIIARRVASDRVGKTYYLDPETGLTEIYQLPAEGEYPDGYSTTSQEVVIPAFLAAYTGKDPEKVSLETFPKPWEMMPNWRVSYTGLKKIEFLKTYFKDIRLNHVYRATYNINNYATNLSYEDGPLDSPQEGFDALQWMRYEVDTINHFIPRYEIGNVSLSERFFPFFGIDVTMHNNISTRFEYSRDRTLSLSMANNQITEQWGREWTVGVGYRIPDVPLRIKVRGTTQDFNSDINIRMDFSVRNNLTIIRRIEENMNQLTSGMLVYMVKTTADYMLSKNFVFKVFFDWTKNLPQVTYSPPTTNASFGFSLLFRLN